MSIYQKKGLLQNVIYNKYNQSGFCCAVDGTIIGGKPPIELSLEEQAMKKLYEEKYKKTSGLSYDDWQKSTEGKKVREVVKKKINSEAKKDKWKSFWKSKKGQDVGYALAGVAQGLANEMIKGKESTTEEIYDNDFTRKEKKILGMNPITASVIGGLVIITGFVVVLIITRKKGKK